MCVGQGSDTGYIQGCESNGRVGSWGSVATPGEAISPSRKSGGLFPETCKRTPLIRPASRAVCIRPTSPRYILHLLPAGTPHNVPWTVGHHEWLEHPVIALNWGFARRATESLQDPRFAPVVFSTCPASCAELSAVGIGSTVATTDAATASV